MSDWKIWRKPPTPPPPTWWTQASPINHRIPAAPIIDPDSAAMVANLTSGNRVMSTVEYALGLYSAWHPGTTRVDRTGVAAWAVDVPVNPAWTAPPGSDGSINIVDRSTMRHWCLWQWDPATLTFSGGGWAPLGGDQITTSEGTATGANTAFGAGLVRRSELEKGRIDHAMVFSTDVADNGLNVSGYGDPSLYRYPATRTDAQNLRGVSSGRIPEGARLQLDPAVDVTGLPRPQRTIAEALQTHGMYCVDNGSSTVGLYCELFPYVDRGGWYQPTGADITEDYVNLTDIPWGSMRVLANWDGA